MKLSELIFRKGTNVNEFSNELRLTVTDQYRVDDEESIDSIAINHVIANLEEDVIRKEVNMLQITGNKSLEKLLELINLQCNQNFLSLTPSYSLAVKSESSILGKFI